MFKPHQSIVNAVLGTQSKNIATLWGQFLKFERDGKDICMVFSNNQWIKFGATSSYQLAHNLTQIFNGIKPNIELVNDEFASQRTGIYQAYNCTHVIEKAKNSQQLGGHLVILEITSQISYRKAISVCNVIAKLLNDNQKNTL